MDQQTSGPSPIVSSAKQRRLILIASCTALMAVIASVTGLNVAQQEMALALDASLNTVLWIINSYTVVLGALLLPVGAIGDRWGRKPVLVSGLVLFIAANLLASVANESGVMIAARMLAGAGAAMIMPVTLSVITSNFPEEERSQAIGVWVGIAGGGGLLGMVVSALLIDHASWRWLFALPIALAVAGLVMTLKSVPNSREVTSHRFDTVGSLLSVVAVGGVVFGIHEGPERGWGEPLTVVPLLAGVVAVVAFVVWELRQATPLLDVRVFGDRRMATGSASLVSLFAVSGGVFIVLFPFFQAVLGWSGLRSTLAMLPMALAMMASSGLAPRVAKPLGTRMTMLIGIALVGSGLVLVATLVSVEGGYLSVLPGILVIGIGMGLTMTPSTESITASLPPERQGVASALNDATREVGTALGVALLGAIVAAGYRSAIESDLVTLPSSVAEPASAGIANAFAAASTLPAEQGEQLTSAARHAFVDGWTGAMWAGVVVMAALFLLVLLRGPRRGTDAATPEDLGDGTALLPAELAELGPRVLADADPRASVDRTSVVAKEADE
jgi:EmrB/QacA subfamily drug resistance transporter